MPAFNEQYVIGQTIQHIDRAAAHYGAEVELIVMDNGSVDGTADLARAVIDADLTWVGPPPSAIDAMGSKIEAKKMMADAGVPMLSYLEPDEVTQAQLPVLVKASAGGGG
ncbi:acetyl/propionyl-CoA carboxylase subunit alpha, partial [Staphylococcus haemolyticus]